ncbi:MAG: GNAT family N-acetyltransferase [Actinomycetota bacterium]
MNVIIRPALASDLHACAHINYEAFKGISEQHNFPTDFPTLEFAIEAASLLLNNPAFYSLVAETDGQVVGCSFMDERNPIRGIGPVSVDPRFQGRGIGRRLMAGLLARGQDAIGWRLLNELFNLSALSLYVSLGFEVKEPLVLVNGKPRSHPVAGVEVRPLVSEDIEECRVLCQQVYGCDRTRELLDALDSFSPFVACKQGRIVAYASDVSFLGYGVAQTVEDMQALLLGFAAFTMQPLSFHVAMRQAELFRWCLQEGLRTLKPLTVMAIGEYQQPQGCYFPSFLY